MYKKLSRKQFVKLQQRWYKKANKLAKSRGETGDIEYGYDLNKIPAQTFRKSSNGISKSGVVMLTDFEQMEREGDHYALESYGWDGVTGIGESDTYERFQRIGEYAHGLSADDTNRRILLAVLDASGNVSKAARKLRLAKVDVQEVWNDALSALALPLSRSKYRTTPEQEPEPEPGPVRSLSKDEIAKLGYKPPKDIK